ncbi:MAG: phospho-N-acetylmuramoyl-pentapeptide-transferase [Planctomycetota bacterium]|jgi:phospho-N-acetylmuramoyl-pentapeptide-transferase|nr:phospho-N-acetylmuramoyl-pentapeptide-transferase [Planctomycetota bacterium]MDP6942210.1 phospho-N-acetylmuramoyl-pentapeptide-transferase [Planctomycetota bacterium]
MITWVIPWLSELWSPLQALQYITVRIGLAAAFAFVVAVLLGKPVIRALSRAGVHENSGANDDPEVAARHKALGKSEIPTMGGVFWVTAILMSTLLFANPSELLVLLGAVLLVGMGTLGFFDDWVKWKREDGKNGLSRRSKMLATVLLAGYVAGMLWLMGERTGRPEIGRIYFPILKDLVANTETFGWIGFGIFVFFEAFVILATSHAANVTDGLDGLAAGSALIAFAALTIAVYAVSHAELAEYLHLPMIPGAGEVAVMGGAMLGATLGFLWYNCHPAEVFMGDSGSLPMGAMIGYLALVSKQELALPLLAGVFVLDVTTSLLQIGYFKMSGGKRLFRKAPIHHAFELKGMTESKIVARFWIGGAISAAIGLLLLKVR